MKKIILGLFFSFIFTMAYSQSAVLETIYLKNGSIVKGMIVEIVPNVSYTVKSADGSIFVCLIADIIKIVREPIETNSAKVTDKTGKVKLHNKGYEGLVEFGYGAASGKYGLDVVKLNIINGYRINKYLFAGGGFGFRKYPYRGTVTIPVFADIRAQLIHKNVNPFAAVSVGVGLNKSDDFLGLLVNSSLGVKFNTANNLSYHFSLGYDTQQMRFAARWKDTQYIHYIIRFSESANINIGVTF